MTTARRRISKVLFMHVFREFSLPFACALAAFAFLFLVSNIFDDLGEFMSRGVPLPVTVSYFLAMQPHHLQNVIPISVLLAASFMTVMLGRNNELCAMRAAGLSLGVCALPVWLMALLACVCAFCIGESWGPAGQAKALEMKHHWLEKKTSSAKAISYCDPVTGRDWFCSQVEKDGTLTHVVVRQFDSEGLMVWLASASKASYGHGQWTFLNGSRQEFAGERHQNLGKVTAFDAWTPSFAEHPEDLVRTEWSDSALTIREAMVRLHRQGKANPKRAHYLKTLIWHNSVFPLASLIAALLGVSLTIANQRTEIMRGFACAIGALVLFYLVSQVMMVLGKNGWLSPFIAGALPTLLFLAGSVTLMWRKQ